MVISSSDAAVDPVFDTSVDGPGNVTEETIIYAHSETELYTFNAMTERVAVVGPFRVNGAGQPVSIFDLAANAEGAIYAAGSDTLYSVDPLTGALTRLGDYNLSEPVNALSFVPAGVLDDNAEVLIGALSEGEVYRFNLSNGRATRIGQYPSPWGSAGDIVSIIGLGSYAIVDRPGEPNSLVRFTFSQNGAPLFQVIGPIEDDRVGYVGIYGVAYWGRSLYGFTNFGELIEINRDTAEARLVSDNTGTDSFWGAGVTTRAFLIN